MNVFVVVMYSLFFFFFFLIIQYIFEIFGNTYMDSFIAVLSVLIIGVKG